MTGPLKKNIQATLAYYDVLGYPLSFFEVHQFLMKYHGDHKAPSYSLSSILQKLDELTEEGKLEKHSGFWFLPGKNSLVPERISREKISVRKLKRMRRLTKMLRYVPFVRMIAGTGSLSLRHGTRDSDWDMLVVFEKKALFTGRALLTAFLHLIGKRRHGSKIRDRACLNYFCTDESLEVKLTDWYASHEYQVMIPFFQTFGRDRFYRANGWMSQFRENVFLPLAPHRMTVTDSLRSRRLRTLGEKIFSHPLLEKKLSLFQRKKIQKNPLTKIPGACITADEERLVFFPRPRGPRVFEAFQSRLRF